MDFCNFFKFLYEKRDEVPFRVNFLISEFESSAVCECALIQSGYCGASESFLFALAAAGAWRGCKVLTVDLLQTQASLHN